MNKLLMAHQMTGKIYDRVEDKQMLWTTSLHVTCFPLNTFTQHCVYLQNWEDDLLDTEQEDITKVWHFTNDS